MYIALDFCDYMVRKFGANSTPEYITGSARLKMFTLSNRKGEPTLKKTIFDKLDDHFLYKGLLLALFEQTALVLVGFLDMYENISYSQMFTMLTRWLELTRHSESFTQLTEQILEVLKDQITANAENLEQILAPSDHTSAANSNSQRIQFRDFEDFKQVRAAA